MSAAFWSRAVGGAAGAVGAGGASGSTSTSGGAGGWTAAQEMARQEAIARQEVIASGMAIAIARQAQQALAVGSSKDSIVAQATGAAEGAWRGVTGGVEGYRESVGSILQRAGDYLRYLDPTYAGQQVGEALKEAGVTKTQLAVGLGAGLGLSTIALVGGGVLLLLLLTKR